MGMGYESTAEWQQIGTHTQIQITHVLGSIERSVYAKSRSSGNNNGDKEERKEGLHVESILLYSSGSAMMERGKKTLRTDA